MSELEAFRARKDKFLARDRQSPLAAWQRQNFKGLQYYPENPDLRLEVQVEKMVEVSTLEMQTSTGSIETYTRYGKIKFNVDGHEAELTVFTDRHGVFLPFADALSGKETYGAGRYLEPQKLPNGDLLVDFNYAYNPYCAYNADYSCPLTPFENRLKVPIRAGEKLPEGDWLEHE
jgi:uncharacterized protein (DUF1684 family)